MNYLPNLITYSATTSNYPPLTPHVDIGTASLSHSHTQSESARELGNPIRVIFKNTHMPNYSH
ncbi:hypothetical protein An07g02920 [Aspergillus niger]|uniref:Uncharacterized protein n=2 Tax=Aspergillus niger TaxID=5061 RepID=A2QMQ2_ASPNC|nr:hypothetical protein An07g02920 [Aspergillus niger]CAL00226.1 hypothetical protein An07g02920 [Aspergillus niger]